MYQLNNCPGGVMVATLVLEASAEMRASSSLALGTNRYDKYKYGWSAATRSKLRTNVSVASKAV